MSGSDVCLAGIPSIESIVPLYDRVVLKIADEKRSNSPIIMLETSKEKPMVFVVVSVGLGAIDKESGKRIPMTLKKGMKVVLPNWVGTEFTYNNVKYSFAKESDVLGYVEE